MKYLRYFVIICPIRICVYIKVLITFCYQKIVSPPDAGGSKFSNLALPLRCESFSEEVVCREDSKGLLQVGKKFLWDFLLLPE